MHKDSVTTYLRRLAPSGEVTKTLRTFRTMTPDFLALRDWLTTASCTHVVMESTGVYWRPVFNLLEGHFSQVLVVNAQHVKAVPCRKKDTLDAEWLAQLFQHALLRASFVPPAWLQELRECTRYRKQCIRARANEATRLQKLLEAANPKLGSGATDILGVSGRAMLAALARGETDPAALVKGQLRQKCPQLLPALTGALSPVQRVLLATQVAHLESLDRTIAELDQLIGTLVVPYHPEVDRLKTIPGID